MSRTEVSVEDHQGCERRRLIPPLTRYRCRLRRVARQAAARRASVRRLMEQARVGCKTEGGVHGVYEEADVGS